MKRFQAVSQGDLAVVWNVIDIKTSTYVKRTTNKEEAIALAQELNKFRISQVRNDLADWLYGILHS